MYGDIFFAGTNDRQHKLDANEVITPSPPTVTLLSLLIGHVVEKYLSSEASQLAVELNSLRAMLRRSLLRQSPRREHPAETTSGVRVVLRHPAESMAKLLSLPWKFTAICL